MDELQRAAQALAADAQEMQHRIAGCGEPPSKAQLEALQKGVERIQRALNRMQTAMDTWAEEREGV